MAARKPALVALKDEKARRTTSPARPFVGEPTSSTTKRDTANNNRNPVRSIVLDFPKTLSVSTPKPVEPPGVAAQYRLFVGHAQIVARQQLIDLPRHFSALKTSWGKSLPKTNASGPAF